MFNSDDALTHPYNAASAATLRVSKDERSEYNILQNFQLSRRRFLRLVGYGTATMAGTSIVVACGGSNSPSNSTAAVTATLAPARQITPYFLGYNDVPTHSPSWHDSNFVNAAKQLRPGTLRYPGGTVANFWDWQTGGFLPSARSQELNTPAPPYRLQELQLAVQATGAIPIYVLNMLTSDLNYQLEMLRSAKNMGLPVQLVELGNEYYLKDNSYIAKFSTGQDYGKVATSWITAIRAVFPDVKISAVGSIENGNANRDQRMTMWNQDVSQTLRGADALTLHVYSAYKVDQQSSVATSQQVGGQVFTRWQEAVTTLKAVPSNMEVWFTEYNLIDRTNTGYISYAWIHGVLAASMTLSLLEYNRSALACFYEMAGQTGLESIYYPSGLQRSGTVHLESYAKTAIGYAMSLLGSTMATMQTAGAMSFNTNPMIQGGTISYSSLQGWVFSNTTQRVGFIVNRSSTSFTCDVQALFRQGTRFQQLSADPLTVVTGANSLTSKSGLLQNSLLLPAYSVTQLKG